MFFFTCSSFRRKPESRLDGRCGILVSLKLCWREKAGMDTGVRRYDETEHRESITIVSFPLVAA
jgi:hypothetical protein